MSPLKRRELLVALGAGTALVMLPPRRADSEEPEVPAGEEGYDWEAHQYAYLIDVRRCIGCGLCVRACKRENGVPHGFYRTWVERYLVSPTDSYVDSPLGGLEGFGPVRTSFEPTKGFFVPKMCNHCAEAPCVQVCPVGASYASKEGVVLEDAERCIGCGYCVQACPFGCRFINLSTRVADKCTWCYHRLCRGLKPACVHSCATGARVFGDLRRDDDPVRVALATQPVRVLQPELRTDPRCHYLALDKEVR